MFTKPPKLGVSNLLKKRDVKELSTSLAKQLDKTFAYDAEDLSAKERKIRCALFPNKVRKVSVQTSIRTIMYEAEHKDATNMIPICFHNPGSNQLCLTVFGLWLAKQNGIFLLPKMIIGSEASTYILRGADLMLPGVMRTESSEGTVITGQAGNTMCDQSCNALHASPIGYMWAVYVHGNTYPFAVGEQLMDGQTIAIKLMDTDNLRKGRVLKILHCIGDELWNLGPRSFPNEGFDLKKISPLTSKEVKVNDSTDVNIAKPHEEDLTKHASFISDIEIRNIESDMDNLIKESLMQAIKSKYLKRSELPMLTSKFYPKILLPCRRAGHDLNIRKSSYKQVSMFLKEMAMNKIIEISDKDGVQHITSFDQRHPDVKAHETYITEHEAQALNSSQQGVSDESSHGPIIDDLYKLSSIMQQLLLTTEREHTSGQAGYLTKTEICNLLWQHAEKLQLVDPSDKNFINLDAEFTDILYAKRQAPIGGYPKKMSRKDIVSRLFALNSKHFMKYHRIKLASGETKIKHGEIKNIEIHVKKVKNTVRTTIANYEPYGIDAENCVQEMRKSFGCSAALTTNEAHANRVEMLLQGNMASRVAQYLITKYHIRSAMCDVLIGKGIKMRK